MAQIIQSSPVELFLPGTCVPTRRHAEWSRAAGKRSPVHDASRRRDRTVRQAYLDAALAAIPRLLGATDRNPYRPTYGCMDREYWHYRTSSFPSEMCQEGVLPLAIVWATALAGNPYFGNRRIAELAAAGIRFAARSSHADGSCDDYYPLERALGAAVFSLAACTAAYELLGLDDVRLLDWFGHRARWIMAHGESGRLANHHALAALGLVRVAQLTGQDEFRRAADAKIDQVLAWQDAEGWFDEYGGADPGYQTVTIDCLAKIRHATGDARLDEPLRRAVDFARAFLHPDGTYGGVYGSRGTSHFYPHGFELLAADNAAAAELADGFLTNLAAGTEARLDDDRLYVHRVANLLEAYQDWSPSEPCATACREETRCPALRHTACDFASTQSDPASSAHVQVENQPRLPQAVAHMPTTRHFPQAGLLVRRSPEAYTVVSTARGGTFKHFASAAATTTDAGLILETTDGRVAVSQMHDLSRGGDYRPTGENGAGAALTVAGPLHWARFETTSPGKQILLHVGMCTVGRWCRGLVRWLLQRRLITGRREAGIRLTRQFEWGSSECLGHSAALVQNPPDQHSTLRVIDTIELVDPRLQVKRMSFGTDHQSAYVAATGGYDPGVLEPWNDLAEHVEQLNHDRRVTITRIL